MENLYNIYIKKTSFKKDTARSSVLELAKLLKISPQSLVSKIKTDGYIYIAHSVKNNEADSLTKFLNDINISPIQEIAQKSSNFDNDSTSTDIHEKESNIISKNYPWAKNLLIKTAGYATIATIWVISIIIFLSILTYIFAIYISSFSDFLDLLIVTGVVVVATGLIKPSLIIYQKEKQTRKRVVATYLTCILVVVALKAMTDQNNKRTEQYKSSKQSTPSSQNKLETNNNAQSQTSNKTSLTNNNFFQVGQEVTIDNVVYKVNYVDTTKTISGTLKNEKADGIFFVISLSITNRGSKTKTINDSEFFLVDSNDNRYSSSDKFTLSEYQEKLLFLRQIHPNIPVQGIIGFEVPTKESTYILKLPQFSNSKQHLGGIIIQKSSL